MDESTARSGYGLRSALLLGLMHAVVDAASVSTVTAEVGLARLSAGSIGLLVLGYDWVAFGMQVPIGLVCDRARSCRGTLLAGLGLTLLGVVAGLYQPTLAMLLAGLGNALFHVGAGGMVLDLARGRAAEPGLFIAPGAIGLAIGQSLGKAGFPGRGLMALSLAICAALAARYLAGPVGPPPPEQPGPPSPAVTCGPAAVCLLMAVLARGAMAEMLTGPWRSSPETLGVILVFAVAGKATGGFFADRVGWRVVPLTSLALLGLLGPWALTSSMAAVLAMFFCQTSTGVTLAGLYRALPGRPGLAFGLASLALLLGVLPGFAHLLPALDPAVWLGPVAAAAFLSTWLGVSLVLRK